jgi:hypothetical protein
MTDFSTKVFLSAAIVLSGISVNSIAASAASISGFGSPLNAISNGTVIDFETTPSGDFANITVGNVTFTSVGDPLTIGADFSGQYNNPGQSISNGFDYTPNQFRFDFGSTVNAFAFNFGASDNPWLLSSFDLLFLAAIVENTLGLQPTESNMQLWWSNLGMLGMVIMFSSIISLLLGLPTLLPCLSLSRSWVL